MGCCTNADSMPIDEQAVKKKAKKVEVVSDSSESEEENEETRLRREKGLELKRRVIAGKSFYAVKPADIMEFIGELDIDMTKNNVTRKLTLPMVVNFVQQEWKNNMPESGDSLQGIMEYQSPESKQTWWKHNIETIQKNPEHFYACLKKVFDDKKTMQAIPLYYVKEFTAIRDHPDLLEDYAERQGKVCLALLRWVRVVYDDRMNFANTPEQMRQQDLDELPDEIYKDYPEQYDMYFDRYKELKGGMFKKEQKVHKEIREKFLLEIGKPWLYYKEPKWKAKKDVEKFLKDYDQF